MNRREEVLRVLLGNRPCVICGRAASLAYPFSDDCFPHSPFKDGFIRVKVPWPPKPLTYCAICDKCQNKRCYAGPRTIPDLLQIERKNGENEE